MVKKLMLLFMTIGLFLTTFYSVSARNENPDYEKYGRIAIAVVKEDFPGEDVTEYEYKGREKLTDTDVLDTFSFQLKENEHPITVTVKIAHSLKNKKLLNLTVEEKKG
ncbi:DUF3889 domain-containing protein [Bacillus sp. Bva_UNVM-123]|uniref:DUF3889 domain-containing protein n=1 Tax=Bacillus sp. Bva_UNVM-123 TaxID=2829798 RepID=UPI00391F5F9F